MARTQSKHYPEIREGILKSAAKLFAEKGYATTTIVDLATACETSRGALYHYYSSKEDILFSIIQEHVATMYETLNRAADQAAEPEERLRAVVRAMVALNADGKYEQIVLLNEINQLDPEQQTSLRALQREIVIKVQDLIADVSHADQISRDKMKVLTMMFLGMINYTYVWYDPQGAVTPDEYAEMSVDVYLGGLLAKVRES
ncbi:TetR/AcrR family transcriptional regulator [Thalassovita taeanensis]|uniref:Transcriptional regulator, TetR family n=1 Tax=Thalassovita taeanensis TaxID=657014 RepID=A0A1H9HA93_9RHOB|nr:TetR/AcrR family transcriptional regulator [Thalassovita taeanensis]SEQ59147.1 transcriptional regulator, TetR family [Thalassovita taeanensis]